MNVQRRRRGSLLGGGVVLAILLAAAALVVALVRPGSQAAPSAPPSAVPAQPASTADADKALCQAIAPLMTEDDKMSNAFIDAGPMGTPARNAAIPKYVNDTQDWAKRIQQVLDAHMGPAAGGVPPQAFLTRTLQRFIDDRKLLAANIRPGPGTKYDDEAYNDSMAAYGGPLAICQDLGVRW